MTVKSATGSLIGIMMLAAACGSNHGSNPPDGPGQNIDASVVDAGPDADITQPDAPHIDADMTPDGMPGDAAQARCNPSGDYVESAENNNIFQGAGGTAEATGLTVGTGMSSRTIGGCLDPANTWQGLIDADFYTITLQTPGILRVDLTHSFIPSGTVWVGVFRVSTGELLDWAWSYNGHTAIGGTLQHVNGQAIPLPMGSYRIGVWADGALPPSAFDYQVSLVTATYVCNPDNGAPDVTEADESSAGHRANDMVGVTWTGNNSLTLTTTSRFDAPEDTGLTTQPNQTYHWRGNTAAVGTDGDSYLDRDTFKFRTGPNTEITDMVLTWPDGDVDLDLFVFREADLLTPWDGTVIVHNNADERAIVWVEPNTNYLVWIATRDYTGNGADTDLPVNYDLTVCTH